MIVTDLEEILGEAKLLYHPLLEEFGDVFPKEIPGMPLKREIHFYIDLVPRT